MICSILEAMEVVLETDGGPLSPYWLAFQMKEMRLWWASEHEARVALENDISKWGERSQFVKVAEDEWGFRKWVKS